MRWPVALTLCLALFSAGCHNCDCVEAELRARDQDVQELRAELGHLQDENAALQRQIGGVQQHAAAKITPELAAQTYGVKCVNLGRQTGGYDADNAPGDEALQVVLEPHDPDGHTIKAPGTVDVQALEINAEGLKNPLCAWRVSPDQLRRAWRGGLLSTAYFLVLPWKNWPSTEKVRVVTRFTTDDGRVFEADKDVCVRVTPVAARKPVPNEYPDPPATPAHPLTPAAPEGETPLPPPRKVDTPAPEGGSGPALDAPAKPAALWIKEPASPLAGAADLQRPVPIR